jgi:hypothetical protein
MARSWARALLVAAGLSMFTGCLWCRRDRDCAARGQMPENYNQCPCPCPCPNMQGMPCGCENGNGAMPMGMPSTVEPPGAMPTGPGPTIIQPAPLPGTVPPGEARPMPAVPSKNTRVIQPAAKTDGN